MTWSKAIDFYALSWGIPRMPACNLVETTQRKSQDNKDALGRLEKLAYTEKYKDTPMSEVYLENRDRGDFNARA